MALYKNLTVSVLRYEKVKTTEAKAKEIRGRVEQMITLAKRGDLTARRAVVAEFPNEPLVVDKLFDEIAPKYADRTSGLHPDRPPRPASGRRGRDRPDRTRLNEARVPERAAPSAIARGWNMTARTSPASRSNREGGRSRENWRPRWPGSTPRGAGRVDGAGRTDAGVHASGQVIAFTYRGRSSATELGRALEALLPADVSIGGLRMVPDGSIPAMRRGTGSTATPSGTGRAARFASVTALGVRVPLDVAAMVRAGSVLEGRHDFTRLRDDEPDVGPDRSRGSGRAEGRVVTIDVVADAFLRGMVRRMVAVLLEVGQGTMDATGVAAALDAGRPALDGASAPPHGLCLRRVVLGRAGRADGEHGGR